ncbi:MAG TPA: methyltransferase domain-containing protein, partial [Roseiflexaceae bacterium]|nr:methyltransferase domain-containing protein [Roseiflexaceae bacterium]
MKIHPEYPATCAPRKRAADMEAAAPDPVQDLTTLRQALVDHLKRAGFIASAPVEAAFRAISRHLFLPGVAPEQAYRDEAIPTKFLDDQAVSSSSQPAIMAIMLEQLGLEPGQRVLEIGAGTGYNAALMAQIVGPVGQVVTIDIDEDIVEAARAHLASAGLERVQVVCGDGGYGWDAGAAYDRIVLTVGAWDIAPAWLEQLKPGGRILLPLSLAGPQVSVAFELADGYLASRSIKDCGFMRLRGAFAETEGTNLKLGPEPGLYASFANERADDAEAIYGLLTGPARDRPTGVVTKADEVWGGLSLWLAIREPALCNLSVEGELASSGIVPYLFGWKGQRIWCSTSGLLDESGLAVLMQPHGRPPAPDTPGDAVFE